MTLSQLDTLNQMFELIQQYFDKSELNLNFDLNTYENTVRFSFLQESIASEVSSLFNKSGFDSLLVEAYGNKVVDVIF